MLVLSRKEQEKVVIGPVIVNGVEEMIEVVVLKVRGRAISLGIKASNNINIKRNELVK